MIETLAAGEPFIRIVLEKITDAVHQSNGNGLIKERMYILRTDL